jgi:ribosomal protein S18 acetylase RimI-like enzyme
MKVVSIASASAEDCRAVAQIHVDAWRAAYDGIVPSDYLAALSVDERETMWRTAVERGTPRVLVARMDQRVAGWIAYGQSRDEGTAPDVAEIWAIYVDPVAWSNGIGQALWDAARRELQGQGYRSVTLWVIRNNVRAIRFYGRAGFAAEVESAKQFELGGAQITEVRLVAGIAVEPAQSGHKPF